MYTKSSDFDTIDIVMETGFHFNFSVVFPSKVQFAEICEMDTDGLIYVKNELSYAPVTVNEISDIGLYDNEGKLVVAAREIEGTLFAPEAYQYAVVTKPGEQPFQRLVLNG